MDFIWDEAKARSNINKHEVSFREATEVFGDDLSSCVPDPDHSVGEDRYLLFGTIQEEGIWWFRSLNKQVRFESSQPDS